MAPATAPRRRRSVAAVLGPILLVLAAMAVLGVLAFVVFGGEDEDLAARSEASPEAPASAPAPARTPLRGLTGGTPSPSASATPSPTPTPTAAPTPTPRPPTPAPVPPTPTPRPPPPPPPSFTASLEICTQVAGGTCQGRVTSVRNSDEWVVLLAQVDGATNGDVLGFELSGAEARNVGSVTLSAGGSGYAYVELYTRDLERGNYTVTLTRNNAPVATASFEKRGGS